MVFFRLGRLDKGEKAEKGDKNAKLEPVDSADEAELNSSSAVTPAQDKPEKKKKNKAPGAPQQLQQLQPVTIHPGKDLEGPAPGAGAGIGELRAGTAAGVKGAVGVSVNDFISKTKTRGLKPSGPELIAYARYLGIDPVADHDLLWIAIEALEAPLPCDWTEHFDRNDRVFYYNASNRVSSWIHPLEHTYRETYKSIVAFRNANMSAQEKNEKLQAMQSEVKQMEHDVHKEIAQWTEHTDEEGNRFYFNREERQSTWTDPRPAKCQVLYLKMKMLRLLMSTSGCTSGPDSARGEAGSRFVPLRADGDDFGGGRRPKVGAARAADGGEDTRRPPDVARPGRGLHDSDLGLGPTNQSSLLDDPLDSDSGSDDSARRKKKKKKKKKHRSHNQEVESPAAAPPPRPGTQNGPQRGREPGPRDTGLGGKMLHSNGEEARGGALSGLPVSNGTPAALATATTYDQAEGLSSLGRARVKAGIKLEPLKGGGDGSSDEAPPQVATTLPALGGGANNRQAPLLQR
mmetsp:Transcript_24662/g.56938  ORF Transcript_24662/g.56938 Transcript_24662/m.56938 type:complete len:516 (-) Transcript_24662:101-1648(-)